jgi:hypothetical protein
MHRHQVDCVRLFLVYLATLSVAQMIQCLIIGLIKNLKGCGTKRYWPNLGYHPGLSWAGLTETTKSVCYNVRLPNRDLNFWSSDCRANAYSLARCFMSAVWNGAEFNVNVCILGLFNINFQSSDVIVVSVWWPGKRTAPLQPVHVLEGDYNVHSVSGGVTGPTCPGSYKDGALADNVPA